MKPDSSGRDAPAASDSRPGRSWLGQWLDWWHGAPDVAAPAAPRRGLRQGLRIYAIGDIHGHADLLDQLMLKIDADLAIARPNEALAIFLGDYVDRGPDSAGVIERLAHATFGLPHVALRGNHEDAMLLALADGDAMARWCQLGGTATMASYGVDVSRVNRRKGLIQAREDFLSRLPLAHREFLSSTRLSKSVEDYFFVHAGARPGIALDRQDAADLMWIREEFLASDYDFGKVVVHGHTPHPQPESRPGRINVDTGAFKWGVLTAVALQGAERRFLSTRAAGTV